METAEQTQETQQAPVFTIGDKTYSQESVTTKVLNQDTHISTLEEENKKLRAELAKNQLQVDQNQKLDAVLNQLQQPAPQTATETPSGAPAQEVSIADQIAAALTAERQKSTAEANLAECSNAAQKAYGDNWEQTLIQKGGELGFSKQEINALMLQNTGAFKNLFVPKSAAPATVPKNSVAPSTAGSDAPQVFPDATKGWSLDTRLAKQQQAYDMVKEKLIKAGRIPAGV